MRTIKFRAWGNKNFSSCRMYPWHELMGWPDSALADFLNQAGQPHNAFDVMQFTGLHDKNGKEIWEGDVVRQTLRGVVINFPDRVESVIQEGDVVWSNRPPEFVINVYKRSWEGKMEPQLYQSRFVNEYEQEYEVLGNIHEHPELIKEKTS